MKTLLTSLIQILSYEVELHEELGMVLQEESKGIGRIAASELLLLQSAKQQISRKISTMETRRIEVVQDIAAQWRMNPKELTLSKIILQAPHEIGESLQHCYEQLKTIIIDIQKLAISNGSLSKVRLKPIEMSLRFIADWQKEQKTYSVAGTLQNSPEKISRTSV
ncbi:MAG: flagellar export chaperone FlgN [SAR324 cluster bacterium]|nr:flagellar export chaperone FlgN [SAR324 cluster bacterium]